MRNDLDPLATLYARFDAITKELAQRRIAVSRRLVAAVPRADPRESRLTVLKADVTRSLERVCPMMPAEELDRLATRVAISEIAYEERAMARSSVHMLHHADEPMAVPSGNGRGHSGNGKT